MKKSDLYLILVLIFVGLLSLGIISLLEYLNKEEDGVAIVYYNNEEILKIELTDGSYEILDDSRVLSVDGDVFHVEGSNPYGVYIKYDNGLIGVIDEESPKNICQYQGFTNSSMSPITCLPNNIVIVVKSNDTDLDTIGG